MIGHRIKGFNYAEPAIERVREMGAESIQGFFNCVSQKGVAKAVEILPNPPGFRSNSVQGVRRKVHLLANRLVENKPRGIKSTQRDLNALGFVWMVWGTEHLGDADVINDYIKHSQESGQDEIDSGHEKTNRDDLLAIELFEKLRDLSHMDKCTREDIKRFLDFSPFIETERLHNVIESCKSVVAVTHDREISALPSKVKKTERDISKLHDIMNAASKNDEVLADKLSDIDTKVEGLEKKISDGNKIISDGKVRLGLVQSDLAMQKERIAEFTTDQENRVQRLAKTISTFQSDLTALENHIEPLFNKSEVVENTISSLRSELEQMGELISEFQLIAKNISDAKHPTVTESKGNAAEERPAYSTMLEKLQSYTHIDEPKEWTKKDELIGALTSNLESINILNSSAEAVAQECIASLLAGQIPYFAGLNGKRIAEACALALAVNDTHVLTVPVGVLSPHEFCQKLRSLTTIDRQYIGCVVIDGINRSALDTFGECLVEVVSRQRSGDRALQSMLIMATLTDGPASLPPSIAHVSLGPVFYTDSLEWHSRSNSESQMSNGMVSVGVWERACIEAGRATADTEEALRILSEFVPVPNPLLKGTVLSGFRSISALRRTKESGLTELQSLVFGWLAPICIVTGVKLETVDQHFVQGLVDGSVPDTRIRNLLRSGIFDDIESREY